MVWKASTQLGCVQQVCPAGTIFDAKYGPAYFLVCEYNPPGNVYPASNCKPPLPALVPQFLLTAARPNLAFALQSVSSLAVFDLEKHRAMLIGTLFCSCERHSLDQLSFYFSGIFPSTRARPRSFLQEARPSGDLFPSFRQLPRAFQFIDSERRVAYSHDGNKLLFTHPSVASPCR